MKVYRTNEETINAWIGGYSETGRNPGDTISFAGNKFLSYSTVVAMRFNGKVYISDDSMTSTTGKHLSKLRNCLPSYTEVFPFPFEMGVDYWPTQAMVDSLTDKYREYTEKYKRGRSLKPYYASVAWEAVKEAKEIAEKFDVQLNLDERDQITVAKFRLEAAA